jgi:hypothetical protein
LEQEVERRKLPVWLHFKRCNIVAPFTSRGFLVSLSWDWVSLCYSGWSLTHELKWSFCIILLSSWGYRCTSPLLALFTLEELL